MLSRDGRESAQATAHGITDDKYPLKYQAAEQDLHMKLDACVSLEEYGFCNPADFFLQT